MLQRFGLVFALALFVLSPFSASAAELAPNYAGTFQWDAGGAPQLVTIDISSVKTNSTGQIIASGKGQYDSSGKIIYIDVRWLIDPKTLRFEMWEANPDSASFTTDGSHVGVISEDFTRITATWTTKETGNRGTLELQAQLRVRDTHLRLN